MTSPIDISALTEIFAVSAGDFLIKENQPEQATTKATVSQMQAIDLQTLTPLPNAMTLGDVFFGQDQTGAKFSTNFENITFPSGTQIWAYQGTRLSGWTISASTGDKLLAVKGGSIYTTGGVSAGTWQQEGINGIGSLLDVTQMPSHTHRGLKTKSHASSSGPPDDKKPRRGKTIEDDSNINDRYALSDPVGSGLTHDHGNSWRPRAAVGLIMEKI